MKKGILALILSCSLLLSLASCGGNTGTQSDESSSNSATSSHNSDPQDQLDSSTQTPSVDPEVDTRLEDVSVEMNIDSMLSQAIVTITNSSSMTFSGNISVCFENSSGESVGDDMIFVEDLTPGNWTYARIDISEVDNVTMDYKISSPEFSEAPSTDGGTLDEAASASLADEFELSFGGAGNSEWATSWYKYVSSIEIYSADTKYAIITVTGDADSESIDRIGNTIFANYVDDFDLSRVLVVDEAGTNLFDRSV